MKMLLILSLALFTTSAHAMTANGEIAALQAAVAANGGVDVPLVWQVSAAKDAGQKISSESSMIFVGATTQTYPGQPSTQVPAVINILLP